MTTNRSRHRLAIESARGAVPTPRPAGQAYFAVAKMRISEVEIEDDDPDQLTPSAERQSAFRSELPKLAQMAIWFTGKAVVDGRITGRQEFRAAVRQSLLDMSGQDHDRIKVRTNWKTDATLDAHFEHVNGWAVSQRLAFQWVGDKGVRFHNVTLLINARAEGDIWQHCAGWFRERARRTGTSFTRSLADPPLRTAANSRTASLHLRHSPRAQGCNDQ